VSGSKPGVGMSFGSTRETSTHLTPELVWLLSVVAAAILRAVPCDRACDEAYAPNAISVMQPAIATLRSRRFDPVPAAAVASRISVPFGAVAARLTQPTPFTKESTTVVVRSALTVTCGRSAALAGGEDPASESGHWPPRESKSAWILPCDVERAIGIQSRWHRKRVVVCASVHEILNIV